MEDNQEFVDNTPHMNEKAPMHKCDNCIHYFAFKGKEVCTLKIKPFGFGCKYYDEV